MLEIKTKAQLVIVLVVLALLGLHTYSAYQQEQSSVAEVQTKFEERLHKLNKHIQEEMLMLRYTHELQRILLIPGVTEALQSGQRQRLYELVDVVKDFVTPS
ncbi:MAG: hypothetical protein RPU64_13935 [Candidatus Sedimenticola sp. (ex Thyasira tokunagai)]